MNIDVIKQLQEKPASFTPGEPLFWDDPHISAQMLKVHLDPSHDIASRRPATIQRSVDWLVVSLELQAGDDVLDLGCGPGLYAAHLAEKGLRVTGVDYSRRSIDYATQYASEHDLDICYRYQDYLTLEDENQYAAALLITETFARFHLNSAADCSAMFAAPSSPAVILFSMSPCVPTGKNTATATAGTRSKRASGSLHRTWFWKKGSIILKIHLFGSSHRH